MEARYNKCWSRDPDEWTGLTCNKPRGHLGNAHYAYVDSIYYKGVGGWTDSSQPKKGKYETYTKFAVRMGW